MKVLLTSVPLRERDSWTCFQILREASIDALLPEGPLQRFEASVQEKLPMADGVVAGSERYTREVMEACPRLKVIARVGVGYDAVDVEAASELGIVVTVTPGHNHEAVADLAMTLVMALNRDLLRLTHTTTSGEWLRPVVKSPRDSVLGLVGLGRIGQAMVRHAQPFGFKVLATEIQPDAGFVQEYGVELVKLEELLRRSDYVSLHIPLSPESHHLITQETIALMKNGAFLINTSRGGLVDEAALMGALRSGKLGGAGLDVFENEPPVGSPLLSLPNVICTPHVAGVDYSALDGMAAMAASSAVEVLNGRVPEIGVLNPEAWERRRT